MKNWPPRDIPPDWFSVAKGEREKSKKNGLWNKTETWGQKKAGINKTGEKKGTKKHPNQKTILPKKKGCTAAS